MLWPLLGSLRVVRTDSQLPRLVNLSAAHRRLHPALRRNVSIRDGEWQSSATLPEKPKIVADRSTKDRYPETTEQSEARRLPPDEIRPINIEDDR